MMETGDLTELIIEGEPEGEKDVNLLYKTVDHIDTEILDLMVEDSDFVSKMKADQKRTLRQIKSMIDDLTPVEHTLAKVDKMKQEQKPEVKYNPYRDIAFIEKVIGPINLEVWTVRMYLEHQRLMKEQYKRSVK
jgi:hypothetical protein